MLSRYTYDTPYKYFVAKNAVIFKPAIDMANRGKSRGSLDRLTKRIDNSYTDADFKLQKMIKILRT